MNKKATWITLGILVGCALLFIFTVHFPFVTLGVLGVATVSWLVFLLYHVVRMEIEE